MQQSAPNHCCNLPPPFFTAYFPEGLKLLLVGLDHGTQISIQTCLPTPYYNVITCESGVEALRYLREKGHYSFDLVISDIALKDIDGCQFIREQHLNPNIAHVAICEDERSYHQIVAAYRIGACSVLWKPVTELMIEEIKNLWRHVCRNREQHGTSKTHEAAQQNQNNCNFSVSPEGCREFENHDGEPTSRKRKRVSWKEIHPLFVKVVNQLGGPECAKPRNIIDMMGVPGLTRAHIGSHLQKYRQFLQRMEEQRCSVSHMYNYHHDRHPIQMPQAPEQNFNQFGTVIDYELLGLSYFKCEG